MSVYRGTKAEDLACCLRSLAEQSPSPDQSVVVLDGPVAEAVHDALAERQRELNIETLAFEHNRGLGPALRDGVNHCAHELVARMDTDDVCMPGRFATQLEYLDSHPQISLVGGLLREWYQTRGGTISFERALPEDPLAVARMAKLRNPVNHPTVMFRKRDVLRAGSYVSFKLMEDYHLFARMLCLGMAIANIPRVFVEARPDDDFFDRRGGLSYLAQELRLTGAFRRMGFHSRSESVRFILMRAPYRVLPTAFRKRMYTRFLRR